MDRLLEGYRRFRSETWPAERARYEVLSRGQQPETLVISCSDSRVDPQTVFGARPGELFVIRNVAGLVPPYQPDGAYHSTSAALEFGVRVLKVARIVVLGHAQCGGVRAMVEGAPVPAHVHGDEKLACCEMEVVRLSLTNLLTFPWIRQAVDEGRLTLHGYRFAIHDGVLAKLEPDGPTPVV